MSEERNYSVIVDFARTANAQTKPPGTGKAQGHFADVDALDLVVPVVNTVLERTGLDPKHISKVILGVVHQEGPQGLNLARQVAMHKDCLLDDTVTGGTTIDRFCGSSMEALQFADGELARDPNKVIIAAGVQSMSQIPMGGYNPLLNTSVHGGNAAGFMNMGVTAENLAELYDISREEQDAFALESHRKAHEGRLAGHMDNEIVPIKGLDHDDGVRTDSSMEKLAKLKTVFKSVEAGGTVTPANSSQISDGAAVIAVTSEAFAKENNLPVKARILAFGESAVKAEVMGLGPVDATKQALERAGLTMDDIGAIELNEAFAAQSIAVLKEFEAQGMKIDESKLNADGGAIAMGHPLGDSGARIAGHVAETLQRTGERYGLATMCIGGGQGVAVIVENPNYTKDCSNDDFAPMDHGCATPSPKM